jgi:cytochrome c2
VRSLSVKAKLLIAAGVVILIAILGISYDYAEQREAMRIHAAAATGGDPRRGEAMFIQYGCGSCHALENVRDATGIAGHLANSPQNMERWIRDPQHVSPGTAMPDLGVGEGDARDITAFLYTRSK